MTRHAHALLGLVCFLLLWTANVSAEAEQIVIQVGMSSLQWGKY
jgi:hypothetical protein